MSNDKLNVLCFGAHPDDCDLRFGGAAMLYRALGHRVRFVSMTNGDTGHFSMGLMGSGIVVSEAPAERLSLS